jgi:hypothetical protein
MKRGKSCLFPLKIKNPVGVCWKKDLAAEPALCDKAARRRFYRRRKIKIRFKWMLFLQSSRRKTHDWEKVDTAIDKACRVKRGEIFFQHKGRQGHKGQSN